VLENLWGLNKIKGGIDMKITRIPFKFLDKYKYFYFAINSFVMAVLIVFGNELFAEEVSDFNWRHLAHNFFFYWGFMYPASFVIYESARKENNKENNKEP
jgi:predicted tellurium resistance membrane protein TerC